MTKILKSLFFILSFFLIFSLFFKMSYKFDRPSLDINGLKEYKDIDKTSKILLKIKDKFSHVRSLSTKNIKINIKRFAASGQLYYEGDKLRLIISSFLGKEMDIGSNNDIFWFWSRRMRPQALYYSKHENVYNTNLRPIFNRDWILDCFVFNRIEKNSEYDTFFEKDKFLVIKQVKKISEKDFVYVFTFLDVEKLEIASKYICDLTGYVMACVEYKRFNDHSIPTLVNVYWYEEEIFMNWEIKDMEINMPISESVWKLPNHSPAVDMAKD